MYRVTLVISECVKSLSEHENMHIPHTQPCIYIYHNSSRLLCPWNLPGKNTEMGCHFLPQGIFLARGPNPCLLHWQAGSLPLSYLRSPTNLPRWTRLVKISHSHRSGSQDPGFVFPDDNLLWSARLSEVEFTVGFILGVWEVGSLLNGHGSFLPHTLGVCHPRAQP